MNNGIIHCLCLHNQLYKKVKNLGYIPVGLGAENFSSKWLRDNTNENISYKNSYYGEYTFHYWIWKNQISHFHDNKWIGFCTYRRFWLNSQKKIEVTNFKEFNDSVLNEIPNEWEKFDVILADKINLEQIKWSKIFKYGKKALLHNPKAIFKKKRNIKFHFDMFHGTHILTEAIKLLNNEDKIDFYKYITQNNSFNQANMFVCKSKKLLEKYYQSIFPWLERCEKIFGFDLEGYGKIRIYAFLAERFLPYWFHKHAKVLEWPIFFYDLNNNQFK